MTGNDAAANYRIASELREHVARLPGAVDTFIRQQVDYPTVRVNVDRIKADESGLTQRDVASSLLISLSSSGQVAPNQWLNPQNGVNYQVAVQTPQYDVPTFDAMQRTPITALGTGRAVQLLENLASLQRTTSTEIESHYNVQNVMDIYSSPDRRDLGGFAADVDRIVDQIRPSLPRGAPSKCGGRSRRCGVRLRVWLSA